MAQKLVIIRLQHNGQIGLPVTKLMQATTRSVPDKVMFVGSPDAEAQTVIASFENSGIPVEVKPHLTKEEDQQLALTYNVTAFADAAA